MPSITFLALLNEGHKLDIYNQKKLLMISAYPQMSEDDRQMIMQGLQLPDDVLSDILEEETNATQDDIKKLEDFFNGN